MSNDTGVELPLIVEGCTVSMDVDSNNTDPKYWERVLQECNLSMNRGRFLGTKQLADAGDSSDLDSIAAAQIRKKTGRVVPAGHGPDQSEE